MPQTKVDTPSKGYQLMISRQSPMLHRAPLIQPCMASQKYPLRNPTSLPVMGTSGQIVLQALSMYSWRGMLPKSLPALSVVCASTRTSSVGQPKDGYTTISNNSCRLLASYKTTLSTSNTSWGQMSANTATLLVVCTSIYSSLMVNSNGGWPSSSVTSSIWSSN